MRIGRRTAGGIFVLGVLLLVLAVLRGPGGIEGAYFSESVGPPSRFAVLVPKEGSFWAGAGLMCVVLSVALLVAERLRRDR